MSTTAPAVPRTKVVLCTSGGWAGARALAQLCASPNIEVAAVLLSTRAFRIGQSFWGAFSFSWRQFGWRYLLYLLLSTSWGSAWRALRGKSITQLARRSGIAVIKTERINAPEVVAQLRAHRADVVLSAFFNQIIGTEVAQCGAMGATNIHPALLPDFRGVDPVFFARLRGSRNLGVTLHRVSDAIDEGNILAQREVDIVASESVLATNVALFDAGVALFLDMAARDQLGADGDAQAAQGDATHYDSWPDHADVTAFHAQGHALWRARDLLAMLRDEC